MAFRIDFRPPVTLNRPSGYRRWMDDIKSIKKRSRQFITGFLNIAIICLDNSFGIMRHSANRFQHGIWQHIPWADAAWRLCRPQCHPCGITQHPSRLKAECFLLLVVCSSAVFTFRIRKPPGPWPPYEILLLFVELQVESSWNDMPVKYAAVAKLIDLSEDLVKFNKTTKEPRISPPCMTVRSVHAELKFSFSGSLKYMVV